MSDDVNNITRPTDKVGRVLYGASSWLAIFGGFVVGIVALMTTISVTGRASISKPIPGDMELIEIGTCTAVFAFLPFCQLMKGNVIVDFFMTWSSKKIHAICDSLGSFLYLLVSMLLTWRLYYGTFDMYENGEITGVLAIPRWISFPYSVVCMLLLIMVILYTLRNNLSEIRTSKKTSYKVG